MNFIKIGFFDLFFCYFMRFGDWFVFIVLYGKIVFDFSFIMIFNGGVFFLFGLVFDEFFWVKFWGRRKINNVNFIVISEWLVINVIVWNMLLIML